MEMKLADSQEQLARKIGIGEWFSGFACLVSCATMIFSAGFLYGQTQESVRRIDALEIKVDAAIPDIAGMKADIKFLVEAERRRQDRDHGR